MNEAEDTELVIDDSNFNEYFFEVKKHPPKSGQIMARFCAKAEILRSPEKDNLICLLLNNSKGAEMAINMVQHTFCSTEKDAIYICKSIIKDLLIGKSKDQVLDTPYSYTFEKFYWTTEECVPKNNPHWKVIKITMVNDPEKTI